MYQVDSVSPHLTKLKELKTSYLVMGTYISHCIPEHLLVDTKHKETEEPNWLFIIGNFRISAVKTCAINKLSYSTKTNHYCDRQKVNAIR
jgi:hypothetical protein